jgi:hypothetical protein
MSTWLFRKGNDAVVVRADRFFEARRAAQVELQHDFSPRVSESSGDFSAVTIYEIKGDWSAVCVETWLREGLRVLEVTECGTNGQLWYEVEEYELTEPAPEKVEDREAGHFLDLASP